MKTKILALALLALAPPAFADTPDQDSAIAVQRERLDGARVDYYAKQTIIAERDIVTAQITIGMAKVKWDEALRAKDANAAGYWAQRYSTARAEENKAQELAARFRAERDNARASFEASAAEVRRLRRPG